MSYRRRGFTLVELLTVISVIAILVAFLLPALSRARDRAGAIACLGQVRTLAYAFQMYNNDWKGKYPILWYWAPGGGPDVFGYMSPDFAYLDQYGSHNPWTWKDSIQPYVKSLRAWRCPKQQYLTSGPYTISGYTMNGSVGGGSPEAVYESTWQNDGWVNSIKIRNKSNKILIGCCAEGARPIDGAIFSGYPLGGFYYDPPRWGLPHQWEVYSGKFVDVQRHDSGCPVVFVDSHGEMLKTSDNFGTLVGDDNKWLDITQ